MRLICPNCDAQYDIDDDVIPEGGRDVQCSNCQHTWFQTDKPKVEGRSTPILTPTAAPDQPDDSPEDADPDTAETPTPTRKPLDRSIADILREEAARDHDVPAPTEPAAPAKTAEDEAAERAAETRRRISRLTEESDAPTPEAAAMSAGAAASKLRTVPSIEEINATLRARAEADDTSGLTENEKQQAVQRRGFRRGFSIVLILIGLAIAPYFFAAGIVEQLPQTRGFMTQYVDTVDQIRVQVRQLAGQVGQMIENIMPAQAETDANVPAPAAPAEPEVTAPATE